MSEIQQEDPFNKIDSRIVEALNSFDQRRNELYDWLSSVAIDTPDVSEYHDATSDLITGTANAFTSLAMSIHDTSESIDDEKAQIEKLLLLDDNERVELFSSLVECNYFDALNDERAIAVIDEIYAESDDESELTDTVYTIYRAYLASDVEILAGFIQERRAAEHHNGASNSLEYQTTNRNANNTARNIGEYALDVAKVALGASIAIAIARRFR